MCSMLYYFPILPRYVSIQMLAFVLIKLLNWRMQVRSYVCHKMKRALTLECSLQVCKTSVLGCKKRFESLASQMLLYFKLISVHRTFFSPSIILLSSTDFEGEVHSTGATQFLTGKVSLQRTLTPF